MVKLSDIDLPMIFKDKLLFSHGFYNNLSILPEEISKSLDLTDWADQRNRSLYFAHSDRDAQKWVGRVNNPHIKNGELFGDLEIHDADLAMKLGPGKAPIGVSAEIKWPQQYPNPVDFTYRGFAMVPNPEVPETMINFSKRKETGYNSATIHVPFSESEFSGKDVVSPVTSGETSDFEDHKHTYSVDEMGEGSTIGGYSIGPEKQPIKHIHGIMAFQVQVSEGHTHSIPKISKNSKQEEDNKDNNAEFSDGVVTSETSRGSPITKEQENSNLMSAERGLNKEMENNANNVVPEVKEDVKEEIVEATEATTEEVKEESATKEVEESKEADFSEINDKFEALSAKVLALEENFAKFSTESEKSEEVKEEAKEDEPEEIEEAKAEEVTKEDEKEEDKEADFSKVLAEKIDKLAEAITKKEAAPMSTAEFGATGNDKGNAVIDRLTNSLSK